MPGDDAGTRLLAATERTGVRAAGHQVVIDLPTVEQRSLDAYRIEGLA